MSISTKPDPRAAEMRRMRAARVRNKDIGLHFGISGERVRQIIGNKTRIRYVGRKFGKLTIVDDDPLEVFARATARCRCDCGNDCERSLYDLVCGNRAASCGCARTGENATGARLSDADIREMRTICAKDPERYGSVKRAAARFGITVVHASKIIHGHVRPEAGGPTRS